MVMAMGKRAIFAGGAAAVAGLVAAGLVLGWDIGAALIGLGCGFGAYIGAAWGNKEAAKTDAYRQEWLLRRKKRSIPPDRQDRDQDQASSPPEV
jgi:hypothetical protein